MQGWVKLHRKLVEWEWYTDSQAVHLFIHLVIHANFEDKKWRGILVKRGQFITGRHELSSATGISEQSIRTNIARLKSTNEITSTSTSRYTIYTIVNYDKFQSLDDKPTSTSTSQLTNDQPATNQQLTTTKNEKNIKNEKKDILVMPDWLDLDLWESFVEHRKFIKAPMSIQAAKVNLASLEKLTSKGYSQAEIINLAIGNGWKGFYEPKGSQNGIKQADRQYHKPTQAEQIAAGIERLNAEFGGDVQT